MSIEHLGLHSSENASLKCPLCKSLIEVCDDSLSECESCQAIIHSSCLEEFGSQDICPACQRSNTLRRKEAKEKYEPNPHGYTHRVVSYYASILLWLLTALLSHLNGWFLVLSLIFFILLIVSTNNANCPRCGENLIMRSPRSGELSGDWDVFPSGACRLCDAKHDQDA